MKRPNTPDEASFLKDVAEHVMTVIRDDGVNRHIQFRKPGTYCMSFELVTWPGSLCYTGDMGTYVFQRIADMFEFFRTNPAERARNGEGLFINPGYWGEKAAAVGRHDPVDEFSAERFEQNVRDCMKSAEFSAEAIDAAESEVIDAACDGSYAAHAAIYQFEHDGHRFQDFDYDSTEYTYRFLWCCYALSWGIRTYDAAKVTS